MRKTSILLAVTIFITALTACSKSKEEPSYDGDLPVTAYSDAMVAVTEAATEPLKESASNNNEIGSEEEKTEIVLGDDTNKDPNTAYHQRTGYDRYIPKLNNAKEIPVTSANLADFSVDGNHYNILQDSASDILNGNKMVVSTFQRSMTDNKDYYFRGTCYRRDDRNGITEIYVQQMLDGEPVLGFDDERADDYMLYGVRVDALVDPDVTDETIVFASGIKLYMTPDEIEAILGKGVEGDVGYKDYPTTYYKADGVTLCIVYTRYEDDPEKPLRARQITLVKTK